MSAPLTYLAPQAFDRACDRLSGAQAAHTDALNALAEAKCSLEHKRAELLAGGVDGKNAEAREAALRLKLFDEHTEALGFEVTLNEAKRDLEAARLSWDCLRYKLRLLEVQKVPEGVSAPYTFPVDIEVLADREADLEALFRELHEADREPQRAGAS